MIQPATVTRTESERSRQRRAALVAGVGLVTVSVMGLAVLQYFMPASFDNPAAVNRPGIVHFRGLIPMPTVALSDAGFVWTFRLLLAAAWIGYGAILFNLQHAGDLGKRTLFCIGSVAVLVAFVFPPSLSSDVYAYAGWGRMWVIHGWNPYVGTLQELAATGDPAGLIAPVGAPTTHGPVWILIVGAVVGMLRDAGLSSQIVALKLLAAGSILAAALSARAIARVYDSRWAAPALLAIGFNPLFLVEGSGSGHNDVLMAALMLGGIALCARGRSKSGYLLLGLSVGIKFVTAAIVPWLILRQLSRQPRHTRLAAAALAAGLTLAPTLIGYSIFQVNRNVLDGIAAVYEHQTTGGRTVSTTTDVAPSPVAAASDRTGTALSRFVVLLIVYGGLTLAIWRFDDPALYLSCWAIFSMCLAIFGAPVVFAWYMVWPMSASLIRWDRLGLRVNLACATLAVLVVLRYSIPYAR